MTQTPLAVEPHYNLKMHRSHYDDLKQSVRISLHNRDVEQLTRQYMAAHLTFNLFAWDMFWVSTTPQFRQELYTYLDDAHQASAMKRILAELGVGAWQL